MLENKLTNISDKDTDLMNRTIITINTKFTKYSNYN